MFLLYFAIRNIYLCMYVLMYVLCNYRLTSAEGLNIYGGKPDGLIVIIRFQVLDSAACIANGLVTGEENLDIRIVFFGVIRRKDSRKLCHTRGRQWAGLIAQIHSGGFGVQLVLLFHIHNEVYAK